MDQLNSNRNCKKHAHSSLEFIQVKNISQTVNKNLFYCSSCINQDLSFKGVDHILINQIATEGETHIIQKWPPIDNQQIIEQLIEVAANTQSHSSVEQSITDYFSTLRKEISSHIDTCQKKMVNLIKQEYLDGEQILKQYQAISQICELQKILLSGDQANLYAKEQFCKEFIVGVEEKNDINTDKLQDLLNKSQKNQKILNFELPNQMKQTILTFIDSIDFTNVDGNICNITNNNDLHQSNQDSSSEKIMNLISNKSNYCTDEFLKEIRMRLQQVSCIFQTLSFENQFKGDKKPIYFEELTNNQLDSVDQHVKHLTQISRDQGYLEEVRNSYVIKSLKQVLSKRGNPFVIETFCQ